MLPWQRLRNVQWASKSLIRGRKNLTHKCSVTTSNKIDPVLLHQGEKGESHTISDGQESSLVLPFENRANNEWTYDQIDQRYLALSSKSQYGYQSRIPALSTDYSSRQRIKKKKTDSSEWLTHPKIFQEVYRLLDSLNTSICFPPMETTTSMYSQDHYSQGTDAMIQNWNIGLHFAFPPFSMISRVLLKIKQEFVSLLILIALVWSTQPCYSKLLNPCVREAVPMSQGQ